MEGWHDFFVAQVGASAALAGLVFVGISINLTKIMTYPTLPGRAAEALLVLTEALLIAMFGLVPAQSLPILGAELLVVAVVVAIIVNFILVNSRQSLKAEYWRSYVIRIILAEIAVVPSIVAGIILLTNNSDGVYWLVLSSPVCYVVAMLDAWVLLIEINR